MIVGRPADTERLEIETRCGLCSMAVDLDRDARAAIDRGDELEAERLARLVRVATATAAARHDHERRELGSDDR